MKTKDFNFDLPKELIAQEPKQKRTKSKLLIYDKKNKNVSRETFEKIYNYFSKGDILVLNNSKVIPARFYGNKNSLTGAKIEFLMLKEKNNQLFCLVKNLKRLNKGDIIYLKNNKKIKYIEREKKDGVAKFNYVKKFNIRDYLDKNGEMPTPKYIKTKLKEKNKYQTVYAKKIGSVAAPTAGLHFNKDLLKKLKRKGVKILYVTLHVGIGTFEPIREEKIENHNMHYESYSIGKKTAKRINKNIKANKKIVACGTTSVRVLESSFSEKKQKIIPQKNTTNLFIYPGYKFKVVNSLITNFHLPESSLLLLVSALIGREELLRLYKIAIKNKYMFYSFGDAMFIMGDDFNEK